MQSRLWVIVLGVSVSLMFGGLALAEEYGGYGTTGGGYETDGDSAGKAATEADAQPVEEATEAENTLESPGVIDAVYDKPCERTVGGVTIRVPACDRATHHALLPVTFPDLAAGTVVNILVGRPAWGQQLPAPRSVPQQPQSKVYRVEGDGGTKEIRLGLFPGINVITISVNDDVQRFRVIRAGGEKLRAFRDVAKNKHWAQKNIDQLAALGVFDGYLEGDDFEADKPVTRGDVAAFLDKIVNIEPKDEAGEAPADSRKHKAGKAIQRMMKQGLMQGKGQGRFAPNDQLTRAEVATLLDRALPPVKVEVNIDVEFKDGKQVPGWARESMARMKARGLISGYADKTVRPDQPLTRAELATVLSRFMEYRNAQK